MKTPDVYAAGLELWEDWTRMWNGAPEVALRRSASRFVFHLVTPEGTTLDSPLTPQALETLVREHRNKYEVARYAYAVGPFVDVRAQVVSGPWVAELVTKKGERSCICGMDIIAFEGSKVVACWSLARPVDQNASWNQDPRPA